MSKINSTSSELSGFVLVHDNLTFYENDNFVVNSRNVSSDLSKVKLIAGGGSGHEPCDAGYIGEGMLTTCVCGNLNAAPSVQHILNAVLMTGTPDASILFIIRNYTGSRLNFGTALELAKNRFNYKNIDMVMINDDISIDDDRVRPSVGRRGLAGTVFYHKIIGAMAAKHKPLHDIVTYVNRLLKNDTVCTIGFTFTINFSKGIREVEIGKGIHGEPGAEFIKDLKDFDEIYDILLVKFQKKIPKSSTIAMMVNNLGGASQFSMNIFLDEICNKFSDVYKIVKIYTGYFLSSLNSEGISVTLINLSDPNDFIDITEYLEYETSVACDTFKLNIKLENTVKSIIQNDSTFNRETFTDHHLISKFANDNNAILLRNVIERCARDLIVNIDLLNKIDSEFGDGDTGSSLGVFATQIQLEINNGKLTSFDNPKLILMQLAQITQIFVGGAIGAFLCLFLQGVTSAIQSNVNVDLRVWAAGVKAGIVTIMKYGHAEKGDRTLLEPLFTCLNALEDFTGMQGLNRLCEESVAATKNLIPKSGRAVYTFSMNAKKRVSKYPDSGAKAVGILVNGISDEITKFNRKK